MTTALYLIITGNYDTPLPIPQQFRNGIDCFLYTDEDLIIDGFKTIVVAKEDDPNRQQRRLKLIIPDDLKEYDRVIYIDANIQVLRSLNQFLSYHKGNISAIAHPKRNCVYQEGFACMELNKAPHELIKQQLKRYIDLGIPPYGGMWQTGVMIRDKNDEVSEFCRTWHEELCSQTHRDQLSISYAIKETGIKPNAIPFNVFSQFFKVHPHKPKKLFNIHYIQPYSCEKEFGTAINEAIERLNADADDYIVLTDYDAMFTTPNYGRHIETIIKRNGDKYALIGCMTNRIRSEHQKIGWMFDEYDMREHLKLGLQLEQKYYGEVEESKGGVAGFCMMFKKSTWDKVKFVDSIKFDTEFNNGVRKIGGKIGLAKGLYMWHSYRLLAADPLNEFEHLKA